MAMMGRALRQVKGQLSLMLAEGQIEESCRLHKHSWRERKMGPAVTVHLCLLQLLSKLAMDTLWHASKLPASVGVLRRQDAAAAGGLDGSGQRACPPQEGSGPAGALWRGLKLYLADGMSFLVEDTEELADTFGKAKNGRGTGQGRPNPKLLAALDLTGGFIHRVIALPWSRQERVCLSPSSMPAGPGR